MARDDAVKALISPSSRNDGGMRPSSSMRYSSNAAWSSFRSSMTKSMMLTPWRISGSPYSSTSFWTISNKARDSSKDSISRV